MKRGAKTQHRRNLRDEKAVYNRTCEEWIVRLHELEPGLLSQHVAGTDESTLPCARTLCFVVTQSRKWLDYRPKKTTTEFRAQQGENTNPPKSLSVTSHDSWLWQ
jgi:hypothetical protein